MEPATKQTARPLIDILRDCLSEVINLTEGVKSPLSQLDFHNHSLTLGDATGVVHELADTLGVAKTYD